MLRIPKIIKFLMFFYLFFNVFSSISQTNEDVPLNNIVQYESPKPISSLIFEDFLGNEVNLNNYHEKLIIINFWATWCAPCKKEMVHLDEFEKKYTDKGLSVLAISVDSQKSISQVRSYIRAKKYSFDVFLDPNSQVLKKLNGNLMPTDILIGQDGTILWRHNGYLPGDEKKIEAEIKAAVQSAS